jgi:hypothetical protein
MLYRQIIAVFCVTYTEHTKSLCRKNVEVFGAFVKLRKANINFVMSVRLSIYDIFINCNWFVTRWQYTFTHKQYIEHK